MANPITATVMIELRPWSPLCHQPPPLAGGRIHVWSVDLDDPAWPVGALHRLLDAAEDERRSRLRTTLLQRRFVVRRSLLRTMLAAYLDRPPAELRLHVLSHNKPALADEDNAHALHFNLSDCGARALYAFTLIGPVGVDVEAVVPLPDLERVAARWFSPEEQAALARLPHEQRAHGFYLAWTRKEAIVKAEGTGISLPLRRFSVSLAPGEQARLLNTTLPVLHAFELFDVPLDAPFVAACAVRHPTKASNVAQ
jgi:4'-phosphopantetheinyl transferase